MCILIHQLINQTKRNNNNWIHCRVWTMKFAIMNCIKMIQSSVSPIRVRTKTWRVGSCSFWLVCTSIQFDFKHSFCVFNNRLFVVGIFTALIACFADIVIDQLSILKYSFLKSGKNLNRIRFFSYSTHHLFVCSSCRLQCTLRWFVRALFVLRSAQCNTSGFWFHFDSIHWGKHCIYHSSRNPYPMCVWIVFFSRWLPVRVCQWWSVISMV